MWKGTRWWRTLCGVLYWSLTHCVCLWGSGGDGCSCMGYACVCVGGGALNPVKYLVPLVHWKQGRLLHITHINNETYLERPPCFGRPWCKLWQFDCSIEVTANWPVYIDKVLLFLIWMHDIIRTSNEIEERLKVMSSSCTSMSSQEVSHPASWTYATHNKN